MKNIILVISFLFAVIQVNAQRITAEDMQMLIGVNWEGELTYLNYSDNKKVIMPATLTVTQKGKSKFIFAFSYPQESNANSRNTLKIKKDGMAFGGEKVTSKETLEDGSIKFTTIGKGKDGGKEATYLFTYIIGPNHFSTQKEVTYVGEKESFFRNGYTFKKM